MDKKVLYFFKNGVYESNFTYQILDNIMYKAYKTEELQKNIVELQPEAIIKYDHIKIKYQKDEYKDNKCTGKKLDIELDLQYIIKMRTTMNILQDEVIKYSKYPEQCFNTKMKLPQQSNIKYFNILTKGKYKVNNQEYILPQYVESCSLLALIGWDQSMGNGKWIKIKDNVFLGSACSLKQFRGIGLMKILFQFVIDYYKKDNRYNQLTLLAETDVEKYYLKFNFNYILDNENKKIFSHIKETPGYYMELKI